MLEPLELLEDHGVREIEVPLLRILARHSLRYGLGKEEWPTRSMMLSLCHVPPSSRKSPSPPGASSALGASIISGVRLSQSGPACAFASSG